MRGAPPPSTRNARARRALPGPTRASRWATPVGAIPSRPDRLEIGGRGGPPGRRGVHMAFTWSEAYATGVGEIDAQHRELLEQMDRLLGAIERDPGAVGR